MHRTRVFRRCEKFRIKHKAKRIGRLFSITSNKEETEKFAESWAKHNADNRTPCSCYACGNPRRHLSGKSKMTIQERRHCADSNLIDEF